MTNGSVQKHKGNQSRAFWPGLATPVCILVVRDAVGRRGDVEGMLKIEEASSLSQVIGFFIAWNILMQGHMVPFQDSLVCIYGVQKRVPKLGIGNPASVGDPSSRPPLAGPACGPSENPITVRDNGNTLVVDHGERCLHS